MGTIRCKRYAIDIKIGDGLTEDILHDTSHCALVAHERTVLQSKRTKLVSDELASTTARKYRIARYCVQ